MKKVFLIILILLISSGFVFSAPSVNIIYPTNNQLVSGTDSNIIIQIIDMNLVSEIQFDLNGLQLISDNNFFNNAGIICSDSNFLNNPICYFEFNSKTKTDNMYDLRVTVTGLPSAPDQKHSYFIIDNSPPIIGNFDNNYYNPENGPLALDLFSVGSDINFDSIIITIDGNTYFGNTYLDYNKPQNKLYITTPDLNNGVEYIIDINMSDMAKNLAFADRNIIIDKNKPIIYSANINEFTNTNFPNIDVNAIDNQSFVKEIAFSCDSNNWSSWVSFNSNPFNYNGFDINNALFGCNNNDGNKNIYIIVRDAADNNFIFGPVFTFLDTNAPQMLSLTHSISQNNVTLNYSATDGNESGIKGYYISTDKINWTYTTNNTYTFSGLSNGDYNFFVKAIDKADNNSTDWNFSLNINYTPPSSGGGGGSSGGRIIYPTNPTPVTTNSTEKIVDTNQTLIEPLNINTSESGNLIIENTIFHLDTNDNNLDAPITGLFGLGQFSNIFFPFILIIIITTIILFFVIKKRKEDNIKLYYEDN